MTDRPFGTTTTEPETSTTEVAKDQAKSVAGDAKEGGQQVAQTAKEQTQQVASEAKNQARDLYDQVRGELGDQASNQHQRAASGLRSLGDELGSMAQGSQQSGVASDLAQQAADRVHSLAGWLETREPGDVLHEVTGFARRKPGTFLAAAAAIGFLGGRLTRGLAAEAHDESGVAPGNGTSGGSGAGYGVGATPTTTYNTGAGNGMAGAQTSAGPSDGSSVPRASGTDFSTGSAGYNPGSATAAPQATTQPTPLPEETGWPEPGTGEERI